MKREDFQIGMTIVSAIGSLFSYMCAVLATINLMLARDALSLIGCFFYVILFGISVVTLLFQLYFNQKPNFFRVDQDLFNTASAFIYLAVTWLMTFVIWIMEISTFKYFFVFFCMTGILSFCLILLSATLIKWWDFWNISKRIERLKHQKIETLSRKTFYFRR